MYDTLKQSFINPPSEYSLLPFWFLNDTIEDSELIRQIDDFHSRGVDGFVLHPRIGMPRDIPYMSERFLDIAEVCVRRAAEKGMLVILYDEASYPSGSACGQVVAENPAFAARRLRMTASETLLLADWESVVAEVGGYSFVEGFTNGKIRGLHPDQEDGKPGAPPAGDLLNPDAVAAFIRLTHQRYFDRLGKYFGDTVIAFFTDEPSLTGRGAKMQDSISWSVDFLDDFIRAGGEIGQLPELFKPNGLGEAKFAYKSAIRNRLGESYYKQLSNWCENHNVSLTGHPSGSGETDVQRYFDIPGQDIVWRWVAPEYNLDSPDGVAAKCGADSARHLGRRRNMNEVLGVCGAKGNPWDFTASDMMWYFNHLFARGVNMIVPHAFFYSLRSKTQFGERPPDVGPGNIWWRYYDRFALFVKRMSWLNTDSRNFPLAAVLGCGETLPHESVKCLYEEGIDFNYVDPGLFNEAEIESGEIKVGSYRYNILLVDYSVGVMPETDDNIAKFVKSGGKVCRIGADRADGTAAVRDKTAASQNLSEFADFVRNNADIPDYLVPAGTDIRLTRLEKEGVKYILLTNEGPCAVNSTLVTSLDCACEVFDPYTGEISPADITAQPEGGGMEIAVEIQPRIPLILAFDQSKPPKIRRPAQAEVIREYVIRTDESGGDSDPVNIFIRPGARYILTAAELRDQCRVSVNGRPAGEMLFIPWELDVTDFIIPGDNTFSIEIDASIANKYGSPVPSGIYGARLRAYIPLQND